MGRSGIERPAERVFLERDCARTKNGIQVCYRPKKEEGCQEKTESIMEAINQKEV